MHDYYLVTLSESLIFLGFSSLLAFDLMGVIWREEKLHDYCRIKFPKPLKNKAFRGQYNVRNMEERNNFYGTKLLKM